MGSKLWKGELDASYTTFVSSVNISRLRPVLITPYVEMPKHRGLSSLYAHVEYGNERDAI